MGDNQELYSHLDWNDLAIFLAVAKEGSMSRASQSLGKTQVTIRNRVSYLEDRLQSKLFIRGATGMILTDVGRSILNRAEAMNVQAQEIGELAQGKKRDAQAQVSLEIPDGLGVFWLASRLPGFQDANPDFKLTLNATAQNKPPATSAPDITVQFKEQSDKDYMASRLGKVHYVPMTTQAYIDKHGCPKSVFEMLDHRILNLDTYGMQKENWSRKNSAVHDLSTAKFNTNCSPLLVEAFMSGLGVAMLPTYGLLRNDNCIMLDFGLVVSIDFWLVYHKDSLSFDRISKTLEWCRESMAPETYPCFRDDFVHPGTYSDVQVIKPAV